MKIVTVGTSQITGLLIQAFKRAGIEVFACIGRDFQRTRDFAEKHGIPYHATDYEKALDSDAYDTVYLGIPNSLHHEYALKALEKGKNVIVEKPFTSNMKEAKELIDIANAKDLLIFDANTTVHNRAYEQLKKDISLIGKIRMSELVYYQYSSKYDAFKEGKTSSNFDPEYSGGALMDLGIYNIEFAVGLYGLPASVTYQPNIQRGIDTDGVALLKYDDHIVTAINGKDAHGKSEIRIYGEKGNIIADGPSSHFDSYIIALDNGTIINRTFDKGERYYHEVLDFLSISDYKNIRRNNEYLTLTLMSMKVLDDLRRSCGMVLKADA